MSISPLPVHMGCFGVSSDAVNIARGYQRPSYHERLATVKASLTTSPSQETVSATSSANATGAPGNGVRPTAQASPSRQGPQLKLQQLAYVKSQQFPGVGGSGPAACSAPNSLLYRSHTRHANTVTPALQQLDFISIAVNSVGGGGVPRPYGKFQACRAGDGNATWERLPPPPGSWQARALPIAVTLLGDSPPPPAGTPPSRQQQRHDSTSASTPNPASPSPQRQRSRDSSPSAAASPRRQPMHGSAPPPPAAAAHGGGGGSSPGRISRVGGDATRLRLSYTPPEAGGGGASRLDHTLSDAGDQQQHPHPHPHHPGHSRSRSQPVPGALSPRAGGDGGGLNARDAAAAGPGWKPGGGSWTWRTARGLHEQSYYRRPGSSLHRSLVPLPPPEPHNLGAWFALPAATFLAEVPDVPTQLRMDNGYSVSREFLKSGLNRPRRPPPQPTHGSQPREPLHPLMMAAASQQPQPPSPPGAQAPNPPQPQLNYGNGDPDLKQQLQLQPQPLAVAAASGNDHNSQANNPQPGLPPVELCPEGSLVLWNLLQGGADSGAAAAAAGQYGGGAGAPVRLRGVYVPLERRQTEPAAVRAAAATAAGEPAAGGLGVPSTSAPVALGAMGGAGVSGARGSVRLPLEVTLPRRAEPAGW